MKVLLSFFALGKPTTNLSRLDPFRAECKEKEYGGELTPVKWFIGNRSTLAARYPPTPEASSCCHVPVYCYHYKRDNCV